VVQPGLDYPLLACDIEGFDPEYISWDGNHASNSLFLDAARDIKEICPQMLTNMNGSLFSVCKIYPTKDNPDPTDKIDEGDNCDGIMWVELVSQRLSKRGCGSLVSASAVIVPCQLSSISHSTVPGYLHNITSYEQLFHMILHFATDVFRLLLLYCFTLHACDIVDPTAIPLSVSIPVSDHPVLSVFVCQHSATGLIGADMGGMSDPLGKVELGSMVFKTDHISKNLSPEWNEVRMLRV
jgi:hypothetical protein